MKRIFICFSFLLLISCGYQLRGNIILPSQMETLFVEGASGTLKAGIREVITTSGGQLLDQSKGAKSIVKVQNESLQTRVLSVNSSGKADTFEVVLRLSYELAEVSGKTLLPTQLIEIRRDYFNDQLDIVGKTNEEQLIREEMYRQAVRTMINQSRRALRTSDAGVN